jgi:hypothetical protein
MKINMYKIYKMMSQRVIRRPNNNNVAKMKSLTKSLLTDGLNKSEMLVVVEKIRNLESSISTFRRMYSLELKHAIENDNYYIEIPHQIAHAWNETSNIRGWIYILTSTTKPGEVKLGATTMLPQDRVVAYRSKYGYPVSLYWYKFAKMPFSVEGKMRASMSECRVSALTEGDSNEWYGIDPANMISVAEIEIQKSNTCE